MDSQQDIKQTLIDFFGINGENRRFFDATQIPRICNDISGIRKAIDEMKEKIDGKYVHKDEFNLIRNIVLGTCGFILITVLSALIYTVIKQGG